MEDNTDLTKIVDSCIGTKFASKWGRLIVDLAVKAVQPTPMVFKTIVMSVHCAGRPVDM